jgi:hypothetical protein
VPATCSLLEHTGDSDHTPLLATWQAKAVGFALLPQPTVKPDQRVRFITPMDPKHLQQFDEEVAHALAPLLSEAEHLLSSWDHVHMGETADALLEADYALWKVANTFQAQAKLTSTHTLLQQAIPIIEETGLK